jgi:hypothetical protein
MTVSVLQVNNHRYTLLIILTASYTDVTSGDLILLSFVTFKNFLLVIIFSLDFKFVPRVFFILKFLNYITS